jgi:predicted DNA-binding transcriptional regulator AlpA
MSEGFRPGSSHGNEVLSFKQWCAINGIGERTGRRILASGTGPAVLQLSAKRIGIRRRDNDAWQETRIRRRSPRKESEAPAPAGAAN